MTDNNDELYTERENIFELDYTHTLSRSFCKVMLRKRMIEGESEFDQLGRITGIDVEPLYEMGAYPQEANLLYALDRAETEQEKQATLQEAEAIKYHEVLLRLYARYWHGYIGNNLGQDLRNFRNFLLYAKGKRNQTV